MVRNVATPAQAFSLVTHALIVTCLVGCGAEQRRAEVRSRLGSSGDDLATEPAIRGAQARGEAALAQEAAAPVFEGLEIRGRGLSVEHFNQGQDIEFSARLRMNNPWEVASNRRARRAETDVALADLEQTTLEVRVERCRRSMDAAATDERRGVYQWYRERLQAVLEWNGQCREAGTTDELRARRLDLEASVRLVQREPRPVEGPVSPGFHLPGVEPPGSQLRYDPEVVLEKVLQNHPSVAGRLAAQKRFEAYAQRAQRRRLPWFGFFEVSYDLAPQNSFANISGQVTVEIPFGSEDRADVRRFESLSRSEAFEAEATERELTRLALAALRELEFFEQRAERFRSLLEASRAGQELADRWLSERLGDPTQVAQLIDEAFQAHDAVVEAQHRAGLAACVLLEATGVPVAEWPRANE